MVCSGACAYDLVKVQEAKREKRERRAALEKLKPMTKLCAEAQGHVEIAVGPSVAPSPGTEHVYGRGRSAVEPAVARRCSAADAPARV